MMKMLAAVAAMIGVILIAGTNVPLALGCGRLAFAAPSVGPASSTGEHAGRRCARTPKRNDCMTSWPTRANRVQAG